MSISACQVASVLCSSCHVAAAAKGSHTCDSPLCQKRHAQRRRAYLHAHPDFITPVPASTAATFAQYNSERAKRAEAVEAARKRMRAWRIGVRIPEREEPANLSHVCPGEPRTTPGYVVTCTCGSKLNTGQNVCAQCRRDFGSPFRRLLKAIGETGD